jgi:hypothetical protein
MVCGRVNINRRREEEHMTCKHRYEPLDIGHIVPPLKDYYYWRCFRCADVIFTKLGEKKS